MRKLILKDAFAVGRLITNANIKENIMDAMEKAKEINPKDVGAMTQLGASLALDIWAKLSKEGLEEEFYKIADDIFEEQVQNLEIAEAVERFKLLAKENDLMAFFQSAKKL